MKGKKLSAATVKKFIEDQDGTLLDDNIIKGVRYVTIKCNKDGNIWTARLNNMRHKKQWCKDCHNRDRIKPININKVKDLISKKGLELLTTTHIDFWSKIKVKCPKHNREWVTSYGTLERGDSSCKLCGHGSIGFDELSRFVNKHNAEFVERIKTKKSVQNIRLKCTIHDHIWRTNVTDIMKEDRWCYKCSREARKTTYDKIKEAVDAKGGILLTKDCNGSLTKIDVKCSNGHEWETYFDNINQGYWCPECPYKTQAKLHDIIKGLFPNCKTHNNYRGFKWLKSNKSFKQRMEIDIWIPEIKLAIEYDGIQHFVLTKFSSKITDAKAKKAFSDIRRRDKKKNKLIAKYSNEVKHFVRFNYRDTINRENVIVRLSESGVKL